MNRKMYISNNDSVFAGVCGGVSEFFGFKSSTLRIIFVLFTVFGNITMGIMLYVALIFLMPNQANY
ncbi:PspC domain-containing protein [Clostridium sp. CCUG 7971]|uniref:PspC domain-containing protein n=1 Tax=Clostridium sp. CCUG 7971 TaxID=2811414 RepID=UPI001ABAA0E8|nr:PspC domain-containing protein [Clostridium sp. CCUG 7971]MBO3445913.1 PspC domain-containing protein [Clostridium sp. CCUG 7971]